MKTVTRDLIIVPTQIFEQGEVGDSIFETAIQFQAYNDVICIEQEGQNIRIIPDCLEQFIKAIRAFKKETCKP